MFQNSLALLTRIKDSRPSNRTLGMILFVEYDVQVEHAQFLYLGLDEIGKASMRFLL